MKVVSLKAKFNHAWILANIKNPNLYYVSNKFYTPYNWEPQKDSKRYYKPSGARIGLVNIQVNSEKDSIEKADALLKYIIKEKKFHDLPEFTMNDSLLNRWMEITTPSDYRRKEATFYRRKQDRKVIQAFCKKVLYIESKFVPKTKPRLLKTI